MIVNRILSYLALIKNSLSIGSIYLIVINSENMSAKSDNCNDSINRSGSSLLQSPRLNTNSVIKSGVLRPSLLASSLSTATTGDDDKDGQQGVAKNPLLGEQKCENSEELSAKDSTAVIKVEEDEEHDERPDPLKLLSKNGLERSKLFSAARKAIPRVEKSGFVFGENVHERVVGENISNESSTSMKKTLIDGPSISADFLFSSVIQKAGTVNAPQTENSDNTQSKDSEAKSLNDVAREYEESRAQKRKYEEVETFTGEENESNIVDISCKLFAFVNSNWEERGRGCLRLNDPKDKNECSRVVFRTSGNLRLLVNTKVWAGMVSERPSQKSLRLTAMDNNGQIKVFLLMARPADINLLNKALTERIDARKDSHPEEIGATTTREEKNGSLPETGLLDKDGNSVKEVNKLSEGSPLSKTK